jgi:hypothetical protein
MVKSEFIEESMHFIILCGIVGAFILYPKFREGCLEALGAIGVGCIVIVGGIGVLIWFLFTGLSVL